MVQGIKGAKVSWESVLRVWLANEEEINFKKNRA